MEDVRPKPQVAMLFLSTVLGILLGTSLLLATKINNPPIILMDTGLEYMLGELVPEYDLEQLGRCIDFPPTCTEANPTYWPLRCRTVMPVIPCTPF